jgi:adenylate cyclase
MPGVDESPGPTQAEVARRIGVSPATLRRWVEAGVIPSTDGRWTRSAIAQARMVARLRERGHSLDEIRAATQSGRLAFGYVEELLPAAEAKYSMEEAARAVGLEASLVERFISAMGFAHRDGDKLTEDDLQLLRYAAAVLAAGFPLVAFLQIARVYGQAIAQMADAEVRLFHLYVHEPLMRSGVSGVEMAEEMYGMARELLPLASPITDHVHQRFLQHFLEQDLIGHMEADFGDTSLDLGRLRVAIAFADLSGYTRLTEEQGEEEAVEAVERFVDAVEQTLPEDARIVKTIGDEVMVVSADAGALTEWAVGFQLMNTTPPRPRIGIHYGQTLYRDGDYYGREVNLAARVVARSAGGEVVVTRPVVEAAGAHLEFDRIGEVRLKGFDEPTELFLAHQSGEDDEFGA